MPRTAIYSAALRITTLFVLTLMLGCAGRANYTPDLGTLAALRQADGELSASAAKKRAPTPDLLALTGEMRDFVDRYVMTANSPRQRLNLLHSSLRSSALLNMDYDTEADGTAAQAFERRVANCLTYAHLFIALARYAGLDAQYQLLTLRPEWSRYGDRVALRQHANVLVRVRRNEHYMVDLDPVQRDSVADSRVIPDADAFALHHNNLAMKKLRRDQIDGAYAQAIRALSLSRDTDYLWVNLGVIYSRAGQADAAEQSYLTALKINSDSRSAMNNLVVLHTSMGHAEQAAFWELQVAEHRGRNPYYFVYLGEQAEEAGDFKAAIAHYQAAIRRKEGDAEFYFRLGKLYFALQQSKRSIHYVEKAIERARLAGEKEEYQAFLDRIEGRSLAQLH